MCHLCGVYYSSINKACDMIPNETTSTPLSLSTSTGNTGTEGAQSNVHNGVDGKLSGGATPMMSFSQAVSTCLTKKYATFKGRARRSELWWFALFNYLIGMALSLLCFILAEVGCGENFIAVVACLGFLALCIPSISVSVRRLHDTGRSGWCYLLGLIPYVNVITGIVLLVWFCQDSERGENNWGPSPKYPNS